MERCAEKYHDLLVVSNMFFLSTPFGMMIQIEEDIFRTPIRWMWTFQRSASTWKRRLYLGETWAGNWKICIDRSFTWGYILFGLWDWIFELAYCFERVYMGVYSILYFRIYPHVNIRIVYIFRIFELRLWIEKVSFPMFTGIGSWLTIMTGQPVVWRPAWSFFRSRNDGCLATRRGDKPPLMV